MTSDLIIDLKIGAHDSNVSLHQDHDEEEEYP